MILASPRSVRIHCDNAPREPGLFITCLQICIHSEKPVFFIYNFIVNVNIFIMVIFTINISDIYEQRHLPVGLFFSLGGT